MPGGLLPATYLALATGYTETCGTQGDPTTGAELGTVCTGGPSLAARIFGITLFVICVVGPFFTTAFLAHRMRRPTAAGYEPSPRSV